MSSIAITSLGVAAAALTTLSFLPQVLQTLRTRDTRAISLSMYLLFTLGVFLWLLYGIVLTLWPVIIANGITLMLASVVLGLKLRHG
ncbi:MAG: SemiSWEET transporter [Thiotrichales bacterium]